MTTEPQTGKILGAKAAIVIGSIMVAGFAAVATLTALDKSGRTRLEAFEQPTAVGEPVVYALPEQWEGVLVLAREGVSLFAKEREEVRDSSMFKAGHDDSGKIPLYRRWKKKRLREEIYVKLAPGEYLELTAKPPLKAS